MPTISVILNIQLIFDSYFAWTCFGSSSIFASSVSGTRKSHRGQIWGIGWLRQHYCVVFGQKFARKQRCVNRGVIVVQKSISVLPQIRAFLADSFAQIAHNLQVTFLIDSSTLKFRYRFFDPFFQIGKNRRRAKTRPS